MTTDEITWYGTTYPKCEHVIGTSADVGFDAYDSSFLSLGEAERIRSLVLDWEPAVKAGFPSVYEGAAPDSLTGRYPYFNWLNVPEFRNIVAPKLSSILSKVFPDRLGCNIQCWANTFRGKEGISWHAHGGPRDPLFNCAHLFIDAADEPSATSYVYDNKVVSVPNECGAFHLFGSRMHHAVAVRNSDTPRVSIAMDIYDLDESDRRFWRIFKLKFSDY